jgi:hypothetical protein
MTTHPQSNSVEEFSSCSEGYYSSSPRLADIQEYRSQLYLLTESPPQQKWPGSNGYSNSEWSGEVSSPERNEVENTGYNLPFRKATLVLYY